MRTYQLRCELTYPEVAALFELDARSDNFAATEAEVLAKITSSIEPTPQPPRPSSDWLSDRINKVLHG